MLSILFFFNDTATTEIYTLSLHDALPIYGMAVDQQAAAEFVAGLGDERGERRVVGLPKAADAVLRFPEGELAPVHRLARRHHPGDGAEPGADARAGRVHPGRERLVEHARGEVPRLAGHVAEHARGGGRSEENKAEL